MPGFEPLLETDVESRPSRGSRSSVNRVVDRALVLADALDVPTSTGVRVLHRLAGDDAQVLRRALACVEQHLADTEQPERSAVGARTLLRFALDHHLWAQPANSLGEQDAIAVLTGNGRSVS